MKTRTILAHSSALLLTGMTFGAVACGGDIPTETTELGTATSALTADCGSGARTVVGTDVVCTYTAEGAAAGANGFTPPAGVTKVRVLVVGGGGGGAQGGGGAGGLIYNPAQAVTAGTPVDITVGGGGKSNQVLQGPASNGKDSSFGSVIALGGGAGGAFTAAAGAVGGSGGGNGCDAQGTPAAGTAGQGNAGGKSNAPSYGGSGGGGGAGAAGDDGGPKPNYTAQNPTVGGNGGVGLSFDISGAATFYAGGGGGGVNTNAGPSTDLGLGGNGGGGAGARADQMGAAPDTAGSAGKANTGGGGGGGDCEGYGGSGGSGIVIVRYTPCTLDSQCPANQWCNSGASPAACVADLANGAPIPSVPSHTNPALDGTCSNEVGAAICASGVCDGTACGYGDGAGPCTTANAATVCRSGICNDTGKCGATVPCTDDAICPATQFCDKGTTPNVCAPQKGDGVACKSVRECSSGKCTNGTCGNGPPPIADAGAQGTDGGSSGSSGASGTSGANGAAGTVNGGGCSTGGVSHGGSLLGAFAVLGLLLGVRRREKRVDSK